jgi:hypothetical protein
VVFLHLVLCIKTKILHKKPELLTRKSAMHIKQSEALLEELQSTKHVLVSDILEWIDSQPAQAYVKTHIPVQLYQSIYEGQPPHYLEGVKIVGISVHFAEQLMAALPSASALRQLIRKWLNEYDAEDTQVTSTTLLLTKNSLLFSDLSIEYENMQLVELLHFAQFLVSITEQLSEIVRSENNVNLTATIEHKKGFAASIFASVQRRLASGVRLVVRPHH